MDHQTIQPDLAVVPADESFDWTVTKLPCLAIEFSDRLLPVRTRR